MQVVELEGLTWYNLYMNHGDVDSDAQLIWDYMLVHHSLKKVDAIVLCGSSDTAVAKRGAELFIQGYAPYIVCSGGIGKDTLFQTTEAIAFEKVLLDHGVPQSAIIIEDRSTNTGENIRFSRDVLRGRSITVHSVILVHKPYMERRTYATCRAQWPEVECIVTSPQISFDDYFETPELKKRGINLMVGDIERIQTYPALGFQIAQDVPIEVFATNKRLVERGFTQYIQSGQI